MKKQIGVLLVLWAGITAAAWFGPARTVSDAERRYLAQFPALRPEKLLDGSFMTEFENYSLDQFPMRDQFRQIKAMFHYYALRQKDNNGIYLSKGYAAKQEYPIREVSLAHAIDRFQYLYDRCLTGSRVVMAIVPDKGCYLAAAAGQPHLDYGELLLRFQEALPWAEQVSLLESLSIGDYYRTDTHWRQEKLLPAAQTLCRALGAPEPQKEDYRKTALERPFYGIYYGQAALPMEPDTMFLLESDQLEQCSVYDFESGKTLPVYDWSRLDGKDMYDVFLAGPRSLLTITNPNSATDRELLIFRDSFGSSIAPLLVQGYRKVTLVDIRYIQIDVLDRFVAFGDQDVLLLYSTLVLNNSETIK